MVNQTKKILVTLNCTQANEALYRLGFALETPGMFDEEPGLVSELRQTIIQTKPTSYVKGAACALDFLAGELINLAEISEYNHATGNTHYERGYIRTLKAGADKILRAIRQS